MFAENVRITHLEDALEYQRDLLERMKRNGKATENDVYMTTYTVQIIEDRIKAKGQPPT